MTNRNGVAYVFVLCLFFLYAFSAFAQDIVDAVPQDYVTCSNTDNVPYVTTFYPSEESGFAHALDNESFTRPVCMAVSCAHSEHADHEIIEYQNYSLCYRESYEQAEWVSYVLTAEEVLGTAKRGNDFRADDRVTTGSAVPQDYKKSGYDRGHLAPAADMKTSEQSMSESFYMTNMSPQHPSFNRGIWSKLEQHVRDLALTYGAVAVVSGPVLEKETYPVIGENGVAVPEFFYKVLLAVASDNSVHAFAYLIPNQKSNVPLSSYRCSVDDVERRTAIDFFAFLPDTVENAVEATVSE